MNTDKILTIPADEYHAESRSGRYMSSHLLADFRESPELYHRKTSGEIAQTESPALALGRAAHCLILEGRMAFDEPVPRQRRPRQRRRPTNPTARRPSPIPTGLPPRRRKSSPARTTASSPNCRSPSGCTMSPRSCWTKAARRRHPRRILRRPLPDPHGLVLRNTASSTSRPATLLSGSRTTAAATDISTRWPSTMP
jgi:hypothetical protein